MMTYHVRLHSCEGHGSRCPEWQVLPIGKFDSEAEAREAAASMAAREHVRVTTGTGARGKTLAEFGTCRTAECQHCGKGIRRDSKGNWGARKRDDPHPWYCDASPDAEKRHEPKAVSR